MKAEKLEKLISAIPKTIKPGADNENEALALVSEEATKLFPNENIAKLREIINEAFFKWKGNKEVGTVINFIGESKLSGKTPKVSSTRINYPLNCSSQAEVDEKIKTYRATKVA